MKIRKSLIIGFWLGVFWTRFKPIRRVISETMSDILIDAAKQFTKGFVEGGAEKVAEEMEKTPRTRYSYPYHRLRTESKEK